MHISANKLWRISKPVSVRGKWDSFTRVGQSLRGGVVGRTYIVRFANKTIRAWTYEMQDGKLEQFQVAVGN